MLPWRATAPLGKLLGFLAGSVLRIRRSHVERAMDRIGARAASEMYGSLGIGIFELLWLAGASKTRRDAIVDRHVDIDPLPAGPLVVCASHTGNWELAAAAVARTRPVFIVGKAFSVSGFDVFVADLRERLGIRVIRPRGALRAAREALANGALVAMPIDQVPESASHATRAPFLGAEVYVDRAPFVLARRANAKLTVLASAREGSRHRVSLLADLVPSVDAAATATAALDRFVREQPASWMWLHRRWREPGDRLDKSAWTTPSSSPAAASRGAPPPRCASLPRCRSCQPACRASGARASRVRARSASAPVRAVGGSPAID